MYLRTAMNAFEISETECEWPPSVPCFCRLVPRIDYLSCSTHCMRVPSMTSSKEPPLTNPKSATRMKRRSSLSIAAVNALVSTRPSNSLPTSGRSSSAARLARLFSLTSRSFGHAASQGLPAVDGGTQSNEIAHKPENTAAGAELGPNLHTWLCSDRLSAH